MPTLYHNQGLCTFMDVTKIRKEKISLLAMVTIIIMMSPPSNNCVPVKEHLPFVVANSNIVTLWGDIQGSDVAKRCSVSRPVGEDGQRRNVNLYESLAKTCNNVQVAFSKKCKKYHHFHKE